MKKSHLIFGVLAAAGLFVLATVGSIKADTGLGAATRIERGSYAAFRNVVGSSYTGTALFTGSIVRPDGVCVNNTGSTVWIGSSTVTTLTTALHPHILDGFPVFSSAAFALDGQMSGSLYFTCDTGQASCSMRCLDGLVP